MLELSATVFENCKAIFFIMLSVFSLVVLGGFILWFFCYTIGYFVSRHRYRKAEKAFFMHLMDEGVFDGSGDVHIIEIRTGDEDTD